MSTLTGCFRYMGLCVDIFSDSCKLEVTFVPHVLPEAVQGKPYSAIIKITGGAMPGKSSLDVSFFPKNSGLSIRPANNDDWYNEVEIYGVPSVSGNIDIHFNGTAFSYTGFVFDKTLTLKVNP